MKRAALFLLFAVANVAIMPAQDNHQGPVVYPDTNAPSQAAPADTAPSTDISVTPTVTSPSTMPATPTMAPSASTPSAPASPPAALSPIQGIAPTPAGKEDDIYDIRPPFFYLKPLTWLWVLLGTLAALALFVALWFIFKPLRAFKAKTPYELALEKLEKARGMLNEQDPEPYAVYVSETIRTYLGQQFRTPMTRRTTEEFLRQMQSDTGTPLLAAHRDLLRHFLEACDLVKFAHYQPGRDELEQVQERAVSFVTATRPVEGVPA